MLNNVVEITELFIDRLVKEGDSVIDATCGNGYDTLQLSCLVKQSGTVYAFDIQSEAISKTQELLSEKSTYQNVKLINDSHANLLKYIHQPISFCIFNLGYLPGGNKKIITNGSDTVMAIQNILQILRLRGMICICAYLKHEGGLAEYEYIKTYLNSLDVDIYNIIEIRHLIRHDDAPRILMLEKKR